MVESVIPTTLKEAAHSKDNSTKSVGARADCLAALRASHRGPTL
jgi:hypothetical protein